VREQFSHRSRHARMRAITGLVIAAAAAAVSSGDASAASFLSRISWADSSPAPGLRLLSGTYANPNADPKWTVTIEAPTRSPFDGSQEFAEVGGVAWATHAEIMLRADGFAPTAMTVPWPRYADDPRGIMGIRVRVGEFGTKASAQSEASALAADGFTPLVQWEGFDPEQPPDGELLHVAIVDPSAFSGSVLAEHGAAVASRETVAAQAQQVGALAAVNAGFFTIASQLTDVAGVPTGLGVYGGRLESLANGSRADLVLDGRDRGRIENLTSSAQLHAEDGTAALLGVNRQPGSAEDCGVPGFGPTAAPRQGVICTGQDDLVLFTPEFGAPLPAGPGLQATIDASGRTLTVGPRGGTVPPGGSAIQAIGTEASWLSAHARIGHRLTISWQLRGPSGAVLPVDDEMSIVSAAPILLRDGQEAIDAVREGVFDPRDLFDYGFSAERHARTIAGIDRHGRLLLVTADGVPGVSEGLTLSEEAELMRTLGATDAMNLDGGGSTTFVVNGSTVNTTSDATGPRAVGDSIVVVP
jgi:Phosphodiester glycosidase